MKIMPESKKKKKKLEMATAMSVTNLTGKEAITNCSQSALESPLVCLRNRNSQLLPIKMNHDFRICNLIPTACQEYLQRINDPNLN